MKTTMQWMVLLACLGAHLAAQPATTTSGDSLAKKRSELVLTYFPTESTTQAVELADAAAQVFLRSFTIEGEVPRAFRNITSMGKSVAIYDTPANVKSILAELPRMLEAFAASASEVEPEARTFVLRHITANDAMSGLSSFRRSMQSSRSSHSGDSGTATRFDSNTQNFSVAQEHVLVVRETPDRLRQIAALIAVLDAPTKAKPPVPQITIQCTVVRALAEEKADAVKPPRDLVEHLGLLTKSGNFQSLGGGTARASGDSRAVELSMTLDEDMDAQIVLGNLSFDPAVGLTARNLNFQLFQTKPTGNSRRSIAFSLSTSATLGLSEYTVIGAFGSTPIYLVVKITVD